MNFEIGKQYIVSVSENGIVPIEEFSNERYFDIEYDSIDFLTDEEKIIVINDVLGKIRDEIVDTGVYEQEVNGKTEFLKGITYCLDIIDKYKVENEEETE